MLMPNLKENLEIQFSNKELKTKFIEFLRQNYQKIDKCTSIANIPITNRIELKDDKVECPLEFYQSLNYKGD